MEEKLEKFWELYDEYILDGNPTLREKLSGRLAEIEQPGREKQLFRPEKNWNQILAWQVLRDQNFIFSDKDTCDLYEGEILAWTLKWDRDYFITRMPFKAVVSRELIKPGFVLTHDDQGELGDDAWNQKIRYCGLTDERGLYLPIYEKETLLKLCKLEMNHMRDNIVDYLTREKDFTPKDFVNF